MAGTTPNRLYPYPTSGDPFDVPGDLQRLAEAIDLDMQDLDDALVQRPMAVVSYQGTAQLFPADVTTQATFNFVHVDTAGISNLGVQPTRLTPTSPGLWCVWGAMLIPDLQATVQDTFLRVNGGDLQRASLHSNPISPGHMATACAMAYMDGVDDYFTMTFLPDAAVFADDYRISIKRMGCFRLTAA